MKLTSTHYIIGVIVVVLLFQSGTLKLAKPGVVCGNGICEPGESERKCPTDCGGGTVPTEAIMERIFSYSPVATNEAFIVTYKLSGVSGTWDATFIDTAKGGCSPTAASGSMSSVNGETLYDVWYYAPSYDSVCTFSGTYTINGVTNTLRKARLVVDSSIAPPPPPWI